MNVGTHYKYMLGGLLALCWSGVVIAHGDEDHGEAPPTPAVIAGVPKIEAVSDLMELLGIFEHGALTLYVDNFETNAPITDATVEISADTQTVTAKEVKPGVYRATLPWAETLAVHPLTFTIETEQAADILEGKLDTREPAEPAVHAHPRPHWVKWSLGDAAALIVALLVTLKTRRRSTGLPLLLLALTLALQTYSPPAAAHGGEDHSHAETPTTPLTGDTPRRLPDGRLFIPKATQRLLKVRTQLTKEESNHRTLSLNGRVIPDPSASGVVQAGQPGRLEAAPGGLPTLGQKVTAGQTLAYLSPLAGSLERGNQQAALAELDSQLSLAERTRARLESLVDSVPQKDIDAAREDVSSLRQRREALANSLYQKEALTAPVSGIISTMEVVVGQVIAEGALLFTVVQPERLWVEALSYDPMLTLQAESLQAESAVLQSGTVNAKLRLVGSAPTLRDQSVPLQFRIEPPVPALPIGQPVTVLVNTQQSLRGIPIPADAVTRNAEGQLIVWVHEKAELFRPVAVVTEALDGQRVMVTSGLEAGLRVVNAGAGSLGQIR